MITISRRQVQRLRGIFRRSVLGITHRRQISPLILRAEGTQLRAQHRYESLAIEHIEPRTYARDESVAIPVDALADFEGRDDTPVVLETIASDQTIVRWQDRGIPQSRSYAVTALDALFPAPPDSWTESPAGLLDALAEATLTGADDRVRYALNCIQLRGATGEVIATDGRQLLVQSGFDFPWDGDVLVGRSPLFSRDSLPRDRPVSVGRIASHVVLRIGPWSLYLEVQEGRYPRTDEIIPALGSSATRLRLDPEDAKFLESALDRLPGGEEMNGPVVLDLNGKIAIRARAADQTQVTELVLARSHYAGMSIRINTHRALLARAVRLGFVEIEIADADSPLVCRGDHRRYAWQPLDKEWAIEPTDDVISIESAPPEPRPTLKPDVRREGPSSVSHKTNPSMPSPSPSKDVSATNGHATNGHITTGENPGMGGLAALIQEAEALHDALADAKTRTGRLIVSLRRHRKQAKLMSSTIAALKQLKLQEVAE